MNDVLLSIQDIKKTYLLHGKPFQALKGITLTINKAEIISLLGVNGAGKTTLSSILATAQNPTAGDILWHGKSIYKNVLNYRQIIGFCPQKQNFDTALTVYENLLFAGRFFGVEENHLQKHVHHLMEQFNLTGYAQSKVNVLSGGYRQRLLIARALVHQPQLVILDEPTIALDPHIRRGIWAHIRALKDRGITVLLTTHYLDEAEILSDRVCILDKGLIRLIDTPQNLLSSYNKSKLEDVFLQLLQNNDEVA